jgi:hypothetical protein
MTESIFGTVSSLLNNLLLKQVHSSRRRCAFIHNSKAFNTALAVLFHNIYIYGITCILQKLTLTSLTCCGRSVGIVRSQTQAMEFTAILSSKLKVNLVTEFWISSIALLSFERRFGDRTLPSFTGRKLIYEAHPVSKVPWGRLQKQNTISWKYLLQQIQQVFSYFSTYSPPEMRHLSYRGTNF